MKEFIKLTEIFPVSAKRLYDSWLNSDIHSEIVGGKVNILAKPGGNFSIWDGYIRGSNISLQPYGRIVQSWRTTEFPSSAPDSKLELFFEKVEKGTKFTIIHTNLPNGDSKKYEKGWKESYLKPMKKYFRNHK